MTTDYRLPAMGCQNCGRDTDQQHIGRVDITVSGRGVARETSMLCTACGAGLIRTIQQNFRKALIRAEQRGRPIDVEYRDDGAVEDDPAIDVEFKLLPPG